MMQSQTVTLLEAYEKVTQKSIEELKVNLITLGRGLDENGLTDGQKELIRQAISINEHFLVDKKRHVKRSLKTQLFNTLSS